MKKLLGNTVGLKADQVRRLSNLYRRRTPSEFIITPELANDLSIISHEISRQIGLLINRSGKITSVVIGDHLGFVIPDISEFRVAPGRLKGLRCVHTHLKEEPLTRDDLTDLSLLRLDLIAAITVSKDGRPHQIHVGHILPGVSTEKPYQILEPLAPNHTDIGCLELIMALESELIRTGDLLDADSKTERALLFSVTTLPIRKAKDSMKELEELAKTSNIQVIGSMIQQRKKTDSRTLMGRGKLNDLVILALGKGATLIIFDQELNPSQIRSITDMVELKVIDRTQLILDIFAQRALTREGKLQVELAQLKYLQPRLVVKNTAMSRLTGGIGGRGPGETKLEINRRRVRSRISHLEKSLSAVKKQRKQQRARRHKKGLPVISIIGYTNAGKSTLLNTLTKSNVLAESRLFATLDPSSRRLKFPKDIEVIITDTVGFIENLPKELMVAFRATLEELENADLLLNVVDISNPRFEDQIKSVKKIVTQLNLTQIPTIYVLNKQDIADSKTINKQVKLLNGVAISANDISTLMPLIQKAVTIIEPLVQH
jgi:GTP-binding protein HflX